MNFTVNVYPITSPSASLLAFAEIILNNTLQVKGFRVVKSKAGNIFVAAPSTKSNKTDENGKNIWWDDVRFLDQKENEDDFHTPFQREVYDEILRVYNEKAGSTGTTSSTGGSSTKTPKKNPMW